MAHFPLGSMRHRVAIERRATNTDAVGGQSTSWNSLVTIWCHIENLTGRELQAAQAVHAMATHRITIRYLAHLTAKDRLVYTDPEGALRYYYLAEPPQDLDMGHRFMQFTAEEGLATQ